jgi:hypothetical protein
VNIHVIHEKTQAQPCPKDFAFIALQCSFVAFGNRQAAKLPQGLKALRFMYSSVKPSGILFNQFSWTLLKLQRLLNLWSLASEGASLSWDWSKLHS